MTNHEDRIGVNEAFALDGPEDNRQLYASWASSYESGFMETTGYIYHRSVAEVFCQDLVPGRFATDQNAVLDVGCGTGVLGQELRRLGLKFIDGLDISPEMLTQARSKLDTVGPIYRHLIEADLTGPITIESDSYAGVVSSGAFTHGHLGPEALNEVFRVAAPGARCAIGINSAHFDQFGFRSFLDQLASDSIISPYELRDVAIYGHGMTKDPDTIASVVVCTIH
jgi:ubiquinone/menaquinone biosynthesis C-methylase UbiE